MTWQQAGDLLIAAGIDPADTHLALATAAVSGSTLIPGFEISCNRSGMAEAWIVEVLADAEQQGTGSDLLGA